MESLDRAYVYIDGNNLRGNANKLFGKRSIDVNIPRLVESIVRTERNVALQKTHYYLGIMPPNENDVYRAENIVFLNRLKEQGIETFANERQKDELGKLREVGIDLKLAADMASDFLNDPKGKVFIVISNDRDFEPAFDMLNELAEKTKRDIRTVAVVAGNERGPVNARRRELTADMYLRHVPTQDTVQGEALRELQRDPATALDATRHEIPEKTSVRKPQETDNARRVGYYIDLNSLGETAKTEFGRSHLDASVIKLISGVGKELNREPAKAYGRAYASIHNAEHDLVNQLLVRDILQNLAQRRIETQTFNYEYQNPVIGKQYKGPGTSTPIQAKIAVEKRVKTQILRDVVKDVLRGRVDDIVLVSNDKNLWPIADLAKQLGRQTRQDIDVKNVHLGEKSISHTQPIPITKEQYTGIIEDRNRLQEAENQAETIIKNEREKMEDAVISKFRGTREIVIDPNEAEGVFFMRSSHWFAMDDGDKTVALIQKLPFAPEAGVSYVYRNGGMSQSDTKIERLQNTKKVEGEQNINRSSNQRSAG